MYSFQAVIPPNVMGHLVLCKFQAGRCEQNYFSGMESLLNGLCYELLLLTIDYGRGGTQQNHQHHDSNFQLRR